MRELGGDERKIIMERVMHDAQRPGVGRLFAVQQPGGADATRGGLGSVLRQPLARACHGLKPPWNAALRPGGVEHQVVHPVGRVVPLLWPQAEPSLLSFERGGQVWLAAGVALAA